MQLAACHLEHSVLEPSLACVHQVLASPEGEETEGGRRGRGRVREKREKEENGEEGKEEEGRGGVFCGVALRCQTFDKTSDTAKLTPVRAIKN